MVEDDDQIWTSHRLGYHVGVWLTNRRDGDVHGHPNTHSQSNKTQRTEACLVSEGIMWNDGREAGCIPRETAYMHFV